MTAKSKNGKPGTTPAEVPADDDRTWFTVDKTIGPLRLARVGAEWKNGKIGLLLDSSVDYGGLHLGLTGLCVRVPPTFDVKKLKSDLELDLEGVDVAYKGGAITIAGAFLKSKVAIAGTSTKTTQFDGMALIKALDFTIVGLGSYAAIGADPSLFIYAVLHKDLGGDPRFRVKGLAAGFGYNRRLIVPPIEQVHNFPLVRAALDENYFLPAKQAKETPIQLAMRKLREYIPPAQGEYWFAIGLRFSSFEMIEAFALLSVSCGKDVQIALLGMATLTIPKLPKAETRAVTLAYAELALRAVIKIEEGIVAIEGRLTSASYLFSRDCHLTGGFAFCIWTKGARAGDFVVTLGGYHPKFIRPAHYPIVPRLGINWQVTSELSITGGLYFALTPSCLMAGGELRAVYNSGRIKAWFVAYADFLLSWQPFYYTIEIGISLGVRVDLALFSVSAQLGVRLQIWGPEFAGRIEVDLSVCTFAIRFGPPKTPPPPLTAPEFVESFLPRPSEVVQTTLTGGLIRQETVIDKASEPAVRGIMRASAGETRREVRVVNAHALALNVQSLIPIADSETGIGIKPMGKKSLKSTLTVKIRLDGKIMDPPPDNLKTNLIKTGVPDALWGAAAKAGAVELPSGPKAETIRVSAGMRIWFAPTYPEGALPTMAIAKFAYDAVIERPIGWDTNLKPAKGISAQEESDNGGIDKITHPETAQRRNKVLAVLKRSSPFLQDVSLDGLAKAGTSCFQADPQNCRLGEAFV